MNLRDSIEAAKHAVCEGAYENAETALGAGVDAVAVESDVPALVEFAELSGKWGDETWQIAALRRAVAIRGLAEGHRRGWTSILLQLLVRGQSGLAPGSQDLAVVRECIALASDLIPETRDAVGLTELLRLRGHAFLELGRQGDPSAVRLAEEDLLEYLRLHKPPHGLPEHWNLAVMGADVKVALGEAALLRADPQGAAELLTEAIETLEAERAPAAMTTLAYELLERAE